MKTYKPGLLIAVTVTISFIIPYYVLHSDMPADTVVDEPDSSLSEVMISMIPQVPVPPSLASSTASIANSTTTKIVEPAVPLKKKLAISYAPITGSVRSILQKIARCESGNNPLARNQMSSAKGLLQIIDGTWEAFSCEGNVLNAEDNMNCGIKIATQSGLHHWDESRACWGKQVQSDLTLNTEPVQ